MKASIFIAAGLLVASTLFSTTTYANDGRFIAAGILNGLANGLSGQPVNQNTPGNGFFPGNHVAGFINGPNGHNAVIMNSALQPGAQTPMPGTSVIHFNNGMTSGTRFIGQDGLIHGTNTMPGPGGSTTTVFRASNRPSKTFTPTRNNNPSSKNIRSR